MTSGYCSQCEIFVLNSKKILNQLDLLFLLVKMEIKLYFYSTITKYLKHIIMNHLLFLDSPVVIVIALVFLLLFGGKKIPELMKGLGKGVRSFKDGLNDVENEIKDVSKETPKEEVKEDKKEADKK